MSDLPSHEMILASAGTGKTYQLTNRYLRLLATGVPPDRILATTFTRKAAGEILDRVMSRLAAAAAHDSAAQNLSESVQLPQLDRAKCQAVLREVIHHLHRLRIGTLDSLFAKIAGAFSWELQLPTDWKLAEPLEADRLRDASILDVLSNDGADNIQRLLRLIGRGNSSQKIARQLRDTVDNLHQLHRQTEPDSWRVLRQVPAVEAAVLVERVQDLMAIPIGKRVLASAREEDCRRLMESQLKDFMSKGIVAKIVSGEAKYSRCDIPDQLAAAYQPLIDYARAKVRWEVAIQTEATCELLVQYEQSYQRRQRLARVYRFDDVTHLLMSVRNWDDRALQALRMDGSVDHLLVDEFQDTSLEQWKVLLPIADRIVNNMDEKKRSSFFCVGDVKQAIYGWRGGNSAIMGTLPQRWPSLKLRELNDSRRSAPAVIATLNQVFSQMHQHPNLDHFAEPVSAWCARFPGHTTYLRDAPGYAELRTGCAGTDDASTFPAAADLIQTLQVESGLTSRSVAVLVRSNDGVVSMSDELRRRQVPVSEEGGASLVNAPGVPLLLSLFQLIDQPHDGPSRFHVQHSPLAAILNLSDTHSIARSMRNLRGQLMHVGYGPTLLAIARRLAPSLTAQQRLRVQQLVELAFRYQPHASFRPSHFLDYVASQRIVEPVAASVRVMTVHQSKGLEFDVVVLPQLHKMLVGQNDACVVGRDDPVGRIDRVTVYRNSDLRPLLPPQIQKDYERHLASETAESLCMLYVAMTRARHALYMLVPTSKANERTLPKQLAGLVRVALAGPQPVLQPDAILFQEGNPQWYQSSQLSKVEPIRHESPPPRSIEFARAAAEEVEWVRPSSISAPTVSSGGDRLRSTSAEGRRLGTLLHAWFERIHWLDDALPGPEVWSELARQHGLSHEQLQQVQSQVTAMLSAPAIDALLRRSFYERPADPVILAALRSARVSVNSPSGLRVDVRLEQPFAIRQEGQVLHGTMDRLVLLRHGTSIVAADVLDFKSDVVEDDQHLRHLVDHYQPQMQAYRRAAECMFRLQPERVATRLLFLSRGDVVVDELDRKVQYS